MYNKPITQRAKSPLKQTKAVLTEDGGQSEETKVIEVSGEEKRIEEAKGGTQTTASAGDYLSGLASSPRFKNISGAEMAKKGYISDGYADKWNDMTNYVSPNTTKTVTTTVDNPDKEMGFTPKVEEKTKRVGTVGDYRNNLMVNRSIGRNKNLERKQQRSLAKEYARQSDAEKGFLGNIKERYNFMRGNVSNDDIVKTFDALNEKTGGASGSGQDKLAEYQQNYAASRNLTSKQQNLNKSDGIDRALAQYSQGGNEQVGQFKTLDNARLGTIRGDETANRIEKRTGYEVKPENEFEREVPANNPEGPQMRYNQNVGVKKATPMKKGYFKGK